ncbi:MAG: hypothetical protein HUJ25_00750 [Crocinitomicaceae bacterium]|nr:hypothetical protein [Crocinitomicaceae bacterium]
MKKLLLISLLAVSSTGLAQENFFRLDGGIGFATTFGNVRSYGISASTEPKFFFNPNISVGLRLEGNVLFGAKIKTSTEDVNAAMSARSAYLLKGEYYLGDGNTKPFFGLMGGYYVQANVGGGTSGVSAYGGKTWGGAPEIGVTFGNFRMSALYHFVAGKDLVSASTSVGTETIEVGRSYFIFQLGFRVFGVGDQ